VRDGARVFTCDVGVPLFTPPELAGQAFRGLRRGANHDNFGLAVLLFHLLYLGRHPFAGKHADGEMPIEQAIAESRFVYGAKAGEIGMTRPPGTPELSVLGTDIAAQFERAFAPPSDTPRPTAAQWVEALQSLETSLAPCAASPAHFYPGRGPGGPAGDGDCCWCALELHTGLRVFGEVRRSFEALASSKLAHLWDAIQAIRRPEPAETLEVPDILALKTRSVDPLGTIPRAILSWLLVFASAACLLVQPGEHMWLALGAFGAAMALRWERLQLGWRSVVAPSDRALLEARARLRNLTREWNKLITDRRVEELLMRLTTLKGQVLELPKTREKLLQSLLEQAEKTQRNRYLDTIRLDQARLPNVTKQELELLAHYDIDTAFEVLSRAWGIQGLISNKAHSEIRAWANACSRNFRFDPARGADPEAVQEIDARLLKQQESLLEDLDKGRGDLETLAGQILTQRATKQRELETARQEVSAAESGKS
jgi:DNA-binding helix-hairpin-helix protein with protein kinase domain